MIDKLTSPGLLAAMEANMAAYWTTFGSGPQAELHEGPDLTYFLTGIPTPMFNCVFCAQLEPGTVDTNIAAVVEAATVHGAPICWNLGPTSQPGDLAAHLLQHGFVPGRELPALAVELETLREMPSPPNFTIRQVVNQDLLSAWTQVATGSFDFPAEVNRQFVMLEQYLGATPRNLLHRYLGYLDGTPVATSVMVMQAGVAGMYAVGTLPEARRRGIGSLMTTFPLSEALRIGYRIGTLQASIMGYPVYQKLGFQEIFRFERYLWGIAQ